MQVDAVDPPQEFQYLELHGQNSKLLREVDFVRLLNAGADFFAGLHQNLNLLAKLLVVYYVKVIGVIFSWLLHDAGYLLVKERKLFFDLALGL